MTRKINNPRAAIDAIDDELLKLLNRRAEIALAVGAVKTQDDVSLCDHHRERQVLTRLSQLNNGPLADQSISNIFGRIIDECLHAQQSKFRQTPEGRGHQPAASIAALIGKGRLAILGANAAFFRQEAASALLNGTFEAVLCPTLEDLFASIERGQAEFILAPLENSLVGSVHQCYDLLLESSLGIAAEAVMGLSHCLIGCPGSSLELLQTVVSHPAALTQCERFFLAHPRLKREADNDPVDCVRRVSESRDLTRAAIGGNWTAKISGGLILQENLEDHSADNYTRYGVLARAANLSDQGQKISLIIRLSHHPGALHDALRPFVRRGIDLLKIESRPIKGSPAEFNFYLDLQAPASESELHGAFDEIRGQGAEIRFLGRYSEVKINDNN